MNFFSPGRGVIPFRLASCCAWCCNFLTLVPRQMLFGTAPFYVRLILQCELLGPRRRSRFYNLTALCWPAFFPFATRRNGRSKAAKTNTAQRSIHSRQSHVSTIDLSILSFQCHSLTGRRSSICYVCSFGTLNSWARRLEDCVHKLLKDPAYFGIARRFSIFLGMKPKRNPNPQIWNLTTSRIPSCRATGRCSTTHGCRSF